MFKNLYNYRELLKTNVKKDIRGKYKASFLGILWSFLNPLLMILVYAIVFPHLFGNTADNYIVYLATGIVPWMFFQGTVNAGTTSIKGNAGILKKVYFPREIFPISVMLSGLVNFFISSIIILVFCAFYHIGFSWHIIFVPFLAIILGILAEGIALAFSAINVYVQDLEYIINFILNLGFYGTPIVYTLNQFGSNGGMLSKLIQLNPLTTLMNGFRDAFIYHKVPDLISTGIVFLLSIVVFAIGYAIFKKLEKGFAEEL